MCNLINMNKEEYINKLKEAKECYEKLVRIAIIFENIPVNELKSLSENKEVFDLLNNLHQLHHSLD